MLKWSVNLVMLFIGALCLVTLFADDWGPRLNYAALISAGALIFYIALFMIPIFEINWTMFVLLVFSAGICVICPVDWVKRVMIFGGVLAGVDILIRYLDLTPFTDTDNKFLERGGHVEFIFPLAGFILGGAIAILGFVIQLGSVAPVQ